MVAHISTVAFIGVDARRVDVQVQMASGLPAFTVVGLPDRAVAESRERVRAALSSVGLALPPKRITVNLAPADLPKEGSHYDLPIAAGLLVAMGVLPAAVEALSADRGVICPDACGGEAARPDEPGATLLHQAAERMKLSARGHHRVLRVARTLADLEGSEDVRRTHVAEALSYRRVDLPG